MNKYRNNLVIYTEDSATRELADAFLGDNRLDRNIARVMKECKGWRDAVASIIKDTQLKNFPDRVLILVIDFDKDKQRKCRITQSITAEFSEFSERIFVIGWNGNVENLKTELECNGKGFEKLGETLAQDFLDGCPPDGAWHSDVFAQIKGDLPRIRKRLLELNLIKNDS